MIVRQRKCPSQAGDQDGGNMSCDDQEINILVLES